MMIDILEKHPKLGEKKHLGPDTRFHSEDNKILTPLTCYKRADGVLFWDICAARFFHISHLLIHTGIC